MSRFECILENTTDTPGWLAVSEHTARAMLARIAELEADLARFTHSAPHYGWDRAERAEARLAAVIALCDDPASSDNGPGWFRFEVRAAATGDTT